MKLNYLLSLLSLSILIYSCGGDDDSSDPFDSVPSGEIVDIELRDATLSGTVSSAGRQAAIGQKWWTQVVSKVDFSGQCGDNEDQEVTDGNYYAFYPDGDYYAKTSKEGSTSYVGSWEWEDEDTKDAIIIQGIEFSLRGLNSDELIIASDQSQASCTVITWEQFDKPYTE